MVTLRGQKNYNAFEIIGSAPDQTGIFFFHFFNHLNVEVV